MEHVHFIGIGGSAIAPLAVMLKNKGYKVTGSEHNEVWEPAKSLLKNNNIDYTKLSFNIENVKSADLIVLGGSALMKVPDHPEFLEAKKLNKKIVGYATIVQDHIIKKNSVVVAGNCGKTTTTSMIAWIMEVAGKKPSTMIGGKPVSFESGVNVSDGDYSVVEGDEFASVFGFDMEPRFIYYRPSVTVLSSTKWDHIELYKTEEDYLKAFEKLMKNTSDNNAVLVICSTGENNDKTVKAFDNDFTTYHIEGKEPTFKGAIDYFAYDIQKDADFTQFSVRRTAHDNTEDLGTFRTSMIGKHNIENALAALTASVTLGIDLEDIRKATHSFKGISRRQEIVGKMKSGAIVIDDFAHSGHKVRATLGAIREHYPDHKIIGVFMPRMSELVDHQILEEYVGTFDKASEIIIPRITVKKSQKKEERIYGKDIIESIKKTQPNALYIPKDEDIIKHIKDNSDESTVVVLMRATGWGDLVEKLLS